MATDVTPDQAEAVIRSVREGLVDYEELASDIFTATEFIHLRRFNSGFIQPPTIPRRTRKQERRAERKALRDILAGDFGADVSIKTLGGRGKKTLVGSGRLRDSVSGRFPEAVRRVEGNVLHFGTAVPYAPVHQFGGVVIQSRTSAFGKPTMPYTWIAHYPQRKFLGFLEPDNLPQVNARIVQYVRRRAQAAAQGGAT